MRDRDKAKVAATAALALATLLVLPIRAAAIGAGEGGAAGAQDEPTLRQYHIQFIDIDVAAHLASQICQSLDREQCRYGIVSGKLLDLIAGVAEHEAFARALGERDVPPASQSFQVMILSAHRDSRPSEELPAAARRALDDVADFLPFRSYHLVDTGWIRTARSGSITLGEGGSFNVKLYFTGGADSSEHLLVEQFNLSHRRSVRSDEGELHFVSDWEPLLSSSFGIDVGETVVVGTSKLNGGDEAMVVLLTSAR